MSESTPPNPRFITVEYPPLESLATARVHRQRYWLHALLFLLTVFTTLMVGTQLERNFLEGAPMFSLGDSALPLFPIEFIREQPSRILMGAPFSLTLLTILLAHEMGHYLYCLRYGVYATLPFFIPAPTLIGTMGAFIRIKSPIRSRKALFDIGIAGPIAGFAVALAVLVFGLSMSRPGAAPVERGDILIGFPLIFRFVHWLAGGGVQATPLNHMLLHPTAIAAWVGMFATALNLLPGGQLDGGHILYSLFPQAHKYVSVLTIGILIPMARVWPGWGVWAILLFISGLRHPNVPPWPELSPARKLLGILALAMLIVTITPSGVNMVK